MEMDEIRIEETTEIILTYRQPETAKPVVLRYERELPEVMRPAPPPAFPPEKDTPPPWQAAIDPPEKQKKSHWGVRLYVGISLVVILVCLGVGGWYFTQNGFHPSAQAPPDRDGLPPWEDDYSYSEDEPGDSAITIPSYPTGGAARLELLSAEGLPELTAKEIYDQVTPSVVTVLGTVSGRQRLNSVGTGVIFSSDGYILTNCHVIAGCSSCQVWITDAYGVDAEYVAKVVGYDADVDLAVLKIEGLDLPAAAFGVSDDLEVGDPVYAIGNPLGVKLRNTLTNGIVSATDRDVDVDGVTMTLVQTTAALNSGNSGGPLINQYGQVIGINTIKMMSDYDTIEGLGFAIPSSLAIRWVNELIVFGEIQPQPVLGVSISKIPEMLPDGSLGLRVESVTPDLSGDRAGVQAGDYVLAFNGQAVTSVQQILNLRRSLHVGEEVTIRIFRDGEYLDLVMTMMAE